MRAIDIFEHEKETGTVLGSDGSEEMGEEIEG
jgi:hypothetical protein